MIAKSLLILSIIFNFLHLNQLENKFDNGLYKIKTEKSSIARASKGQDLPEIAYLPKINKNADKVSINSKIYLLGDLESGEVIIKKNQSDRVPIASTTKIMTAIVALENYNLDEEVSVSTAAAYQAGADSYLRVGEKITVSELLHCLLIKSGNDSAYALAEHMYQKRNPQVINESQTDITNDSKKTTSEFVAKMNQKALSLGMINTEYHDPAGLDVTGYSSAYDLYLATKYAMKNTTFRKIVVTKEYVAKNVDSTIFHQLTNSNRLVNEYQYPGAIGVKTGYMPEAGHCLVSAVERDGKTLIGVVLNTFADTATASADESRKLQDWGWQNIGWE